MKNTLVIYASFGQGHKIAAVALEKALDAPCYDLLDFCHPIIRKFYSSSYLFITEHMPLLWQIMFHTTGNPVIKTIVSFFNKLVFASFFRYLKDNDIKLIVATHFFPVNILTITRRKPKLNIISIVTDLRVHRLWVDPIVDHYIAASEETKQDLINYGVNEKIITPGFVALREGFLLSCDEAQLRAKFALDNKPAVLFISSSRGRFLYLAQLLPQLIKKYNLFIIYGKNKGLKAYLDKFPQDSIRALSTYDKMWELMTVVSTIVTKPGGLTVFEGLYKKKTFVFTHYIPGQEEGNMALLKKYGIGDYARNKEALLKYMEIFTKKQPTLKENYPLIMKDIRTVIDKIIQQVVTNER